MAKEKTSHPSSPLEALPTQLTELLPNHQLVKIDTRQTSPAVDSATLTITRIPPNMLNNFNSGLNRVPVYIIHEQGSPPYYIPDGPRLRINGITPTASINTSIAKDETIKTAQVGPNGRVNPSPLEEHNFLAILNGEARAKTIASSLNKITQMSIVGVVLFMGFNASPTETASQSVSIDGLLLVDH